MHKHPLDCHLCGTEFLGYRASDKFCSSYCRWRNKFEQRTQEQARRRQAYQKKWGSVTWQRRRDYMIAYTYGITPEQYQELLEKQQYCCAVCGKHETEFSRKLAIDHDHQTFEIFGLLCRTCNHTLIGKHRDPALFRAAANYLEKG